MASTDPAAKRDKLDAEVMKMRRRALTLLFGDNPTGAERLAFNAMFFLPESLPDVADLTDSELREALQTTMLRILRVPSGSSVFQVSQRAQLAVSLSAAVLAASAVRYRKSVRSCRSVSWYPAQIWSIAVFMPESTR